MSPSNGGELANMFEPVVTSVFANVDLPLFVYFSSSSKCKYFFLSFEVNVTIFTIWSKFHYLYGNFKRAIIVLKNSV